MYSISHYTHHVLREELAHDDADVGRVDLVDESVDGLLERLPAQPLELHAGLVRHGLLHQTQLGRRDVRAARLARQHRRVRLLLFLQSVESELLNSA